MTRVLAGPWASQLLGDYGADVVKIERPGSGDDTRAWGPPWLDGQAGGESAYFLCANRNKRSVTVNIAEKRGQDVIRDLAASADVLIENYRVGTMRRYGLSADDLRAANPRLIYCSISAFGQESSRSSELGYDAMIQASAGLMSITGAPDEAGGSAQKVGVAIADIMAGMYATTAVLAALHAREVTGEGQTIDVPLYDSQVAWLANQNMNYLVGGAVPQRMGTAHPNLVPYQAFEASDGSFMLAVGNDRQFAACADGVGRPELAHDPRFARNQDRIANRPELVKQLDAAFREKSRSHWLGEMRSRNVPVGPINDIGQVFDSPYAKERRLVRELRNSSATMVPSVANPVDFSSTPVRYDKAPPLLGEHTEEVLKEWLGYPDEVIRELRAASAIA